MLGADNDASKASRTARDNATIAWNYFQVFYLFIYKGNPYINFGYHDRGCAQDNA